MSLAKITELQDLKGEANQLINAWLENFNGHKANALTDALDEMKNHLANQGFIVSDIATPNRGFAANYKGLEIKAKASRDDEQYFGMDYCIELVSGAVKAEVDLSAGRNQSITAPTAQDTDSLIKDYRERYIPALKLRQDEAFNNNHTLRLRRNIPTVQPVALKNGAEAIDKFSELLASN